MIHKKLLSLLVLLLTAVSGAWAQEVTPIGLYLEVSGTEATLMYDANFNAGSGKPYYGVEEMGSPGWYVAKGPVPGSYEDNMTLTTVTIDASCKNYTGTTLYRLFDWWEKLTTINNLENLNTSTVTSMYRMFACCSSLTSLDLSCLNTASVMNMHEMFIGLNLETIDLSGWDTSNVTDMGFMFYNCPNLKYIYVTGELSTASVTSGNYMFSQCPNLPGFDSDNDTYAMAKLTPDGYLTYKSPFDYVFSVAESERGTVTFFKDDKKVMGADEGDLVTVTVTPAEGYVLGSVTANAYTTWDSANRRVMAAIPVLGDVELTPVEGKDNTWTFTMPAANVELQAAFLATSNIYLGKEALADKDNITVKDGETALAFDDNGKSTATVLEGNTVTTTYTGTKKVLGMKVEKKASAPTLKDALADGATVVITYTWYGTDVTTFTYTNNGGTYTGNTTGDDAEYFTNGMSKDGTTLKFTASNPDHSDANVSIDFNTDTNEYVANKGSGFTSFTISVNGTDVTSQLTEVVDETGD